MRLDEPLGNRQPQTHSGSVPVHAYKILKDLLMMFRCDARSRVRYAYFHAVRARQPKPAPLFHRSQGRHTPFPEMWPRTQRDASPARRMLQRVIEQIRRRLLYLLIIESELRNVRSQSPIPLPAFTFNRSAPP